MQPQDLFDNWLEGTIHAGKQVDARGVHLTAGHILWPRSRGHVDFGGSEFERYGGAAGSELSPEERAALGLQTVYFDFDQYSLSSGARETLRRNTEILRSRPEILVEIQGNCDDRGSEEYNLALGEQRARSAKDYLVDSGVPRQRISTVSFGESNPAAMGQSERAWQLNRRDDFVPKR